MRCVRVVFLLVLLCAFHAARAQQEVDKTNDDAAEKPLVQGDIVINEVLGQPANDTAQLSAAKDWDVITASVEWAELANKGSSEADVSGWTLVRADRQASDGWQIPAGTKIAAAGTLLVLCPRSKQVLPPIPGTVNVRVAQDLRVGSNGLTLYSGAGALVASTGRLPENMPGVTVGLPQPAPAAGSAQYTYLEKPTPFVANSAAKPGIGPFIRSISADPDSAVSPGTPITVSAKLRRNQAPVASATLLARVNYAPEQELPMTAGGDASDYGEVEYSATIPGSLVTAGSMIRWRVKATDSASATSLLPNGLAEGEPLCEGTVVPIADAEAAGKGPQIPVLYWFTDNAAASATVAGHPGSISFNGVFYDNVFGARRGVTSQSWPKPKLKFDVPNGFTMRPDVPEMNTVLLNSYWFEVGERSFMKEAVAYQVMADEGVIAPLNQYVQVYLNGQFYGLYGLIEKIDSNMLERYNLPDDGPIFKSESGELSNLRWDLPVAEMPAYYSRPNRKQYTADWELLAALTKGLAGGGPGSRTSFVFDALNLPAVINENAVQTLLLNQDRCTKNFLVYYNPDTKEWIRIPWDIETSFAQDNGLGGSPGPYYCILACEQWNSPLYCDSEHPQDIGGVQTTWGTVTVVGMNPFQGSAVASTGRRLLQNGTGLKAEGNKPLTFPTSPDWANPDRIHSGSRSPFGAAGTYNHLTDAILDVEATRAMYLRRLRTLADKYYGQGKLRELVDVTWNRIKGFAAQDNAIWKQGDGTRGYTQITTEFIPIRAKQLLETYGPRGANPLLPGPQPPSFQITLGIDAAEAASQADQSYVALAVRSPADLAVDVSNWKLTAGSTTWTFPPGTVIPPGKRLHLTPSVAAFRSRSNSPKAGEAVFVIQAPAGLMPTGGGSSVSWSVADENGSSVSMS